MPIEIRFAQQVSQSMPLRLSIFQVVKLWFVDGLNERVVLSSDCQEAES